MPAMVHMQTFHTGLVMSALNMEAGKSRYSYRRHFLLHRENDCALLNDTRAP
jgi:hypothetical protein